MILGDMSEAQTAAWIGLLEVSERLPAKSWCLVGGQMVFLYCRERGFVRSRPTDDGDVVLDVRAIPAILHDFTTALVDIGFESVGLTPQGHQHRWVRNKASIDVLIPSNLGDKASSRKGVTGSTTISTPGAQQPSTEPRRSK